jgi:hypothetical protein
LRAVVDPFEGRSRMRRSLGLRLGLALGVALFIAGPLTASSAMAAKHHKKKTAPTTTPAPKAASIAVSGDLTELGDGDVGFALSGAGWFANEEIDVSSPGLYTGCGFSYWDDVAILNPEFAGGGFAASHTDGLLDTDFSGAFNLAVTLYVCAPGTYEVTAQEVLSPSRVATTDLVITAPATASSASEVLSPAKQIETGTSGEIAGTVLLAGLNPNETVDVSSPTLALACSGPSLWIDSLSGFDTNIAFAVAAGTDFSGNGIVAFSAETCNAGIYPIDATETGAGFRSFDADFTVTAP